MKACSLHYLVDRNYKVLPEDEIIQTLKTKFCYIKAQGLWSPSEGNKLDMGGDLDGLKLDTNNMAESQKRGKTGGNGRPQSEKARDSIRINCFWYHKKGNLQDNHPLLKKSGTSYGNEETQETGSEPSTDWRYKRPENWYPDTKVVNDTTYNFCNKFVLYNSGGSRDSSDNHKKKEEMSKLKYSSVNVTTIHDDNLPVGGSLNLTEILFLW